MISNNRNRSARQVIKWAAVFGGAFGLLLLIGGAADYAAGYCGENEILCGINYLFRITGLFLCMLLYRNKVLHRNITFGQAFLFGFTTFFIAMMVMDASICIAFNYFPELLAAKLVIIEERLLGYGLNEARIQAELDLAQWVRRPHHVALSFAIWSFFIGPFVSLIAAVMLMNTPARRRLKRRRKRRRMVRKPEEPSISKLLLKSRPEFDPDNSERGGMD